MFGWVPGTRPNISESHSEISTRVPFCIATSLSPNRTSSTFGETTNEFLRQMGLIGAPRLFGVSQRRRKKANLFHPSLAASQRGFYIASAAAAATAAPALPRRPLQCHGGSAVPLPRPPCWPAALLRRCPAAARLLAADNVSVPMEDGFARQISQGLSQPRSLSASRSVPRALLTPRVKSRATLSLQKEHF